MNVGDIVKVRLDQSFVQGRIIGIPENRGNVFEGVNGPNASGPKPDYGQRCHFPDVEIRGFLASEIRLLLLPR
jgi:hypothetical protein